MISKNSNKNNIIKPLNAIVIGDVGSGKTIVAFLVGLSFLRSKFNLSQSSNVAMLAPTEVLAFQHYQGLLAFKESREELQFVAIIYRSGKNYMINAQSFTPAKFAKELITIKESCQHFFWVGTHALLYENNLEEDFAPSLVMVDEQHRFGVKQRQKLADSSQLAHFVSFTATPIPRTLALSMYDSLNTFWLDKLKSRNPIHTTITSFDKWNEIENTIQKHLGSNNKVYIICPLVEESENIEDQKKEKKETVKTTVKTTVNKSENTAQNLKSVEQTVAKVQQVFANQVLAVHGKLKEKREILKEFKESTTRNILVSTTVVEVGVDVGEATLMVILNAERFGLSALHQIRGRIGRNSYDNNQCLLVTENNFQNSTRLKSLTQNQDGFELSKIDLELRGSGDAIGTTQSGFDKELSVITKLNQDKLQKLINLVKESQINIDKLPRLSKYCQSKANEIWSE